MRKHLDRIRFRGQKRDEFLDLAESPNTSDTECTEEILIKPRGSVRDLEELREMDGEQQSDAQVGEVESKSTTLRLRSQLFSCFSSQAGPGSFSASLQDDTRSDLSEIKGHLEIALLEKHFLREYIPPPKKIERLVA